MGNALATWFKTALNDNAVDITLLPRPELNGYSTRPEVKESMDTIMLVRSQGGIQAAKEIWASKIAPLIPDIAQVVNRPRKLWHIDELANRPPQEWLIPGKVLANGMMVIYGPSEAGKSFLAVDYAAQISLTKPVIYIAGEGQSGYYARYKAWLKHHGHDKSGQFYLFEEPVQMLDKTSVDNFIEEVATIKPALVVVDTLIRCFEGGDENQSKDINTFTASCDRIRRTFGCAVVIIHHVTKGTGSERGSGALRNNCDGMIEVQNEEGNIKVICSKTKDIAHWETEIYRRLEIEIEQNGLPVKTCVLADWRLVKLDPEKFSHNQYAVMSALASELYFDCGARAADISSITGISRQTLYTVLRTLAKRGLIEKPPRKSDPYMITTKGMQLMNQAVQQKLKVA